MAYNWIYTNSNDNIYILILIIIILSFIILDFELLKKKTDKFYNVQNNAQTTKPQTTKPQTTKPQSTMYQRPTYENQMNPNFYISKEEEERRNAWSQLDGNEESLANTNGTNFGRSTGLINFQHDITQTNSTLFNNGKDNVNAGNYATIGDYATLDSLGSNLTDTLGGIKTDLGYTILDEQLGTFNKYSQPPYNNPNTYDNTLNYKTGMNPSTVDGMSAKISGSGQGFSGKFIQDNKPVYLQKDFQGVANIFAPNIIISNPPLINDGIPDISFEI